jgi:hypothetical protein
MIRCGEAIDNIKLDGIKEVTLPNCLATSDYYELTGTTPIEVESKIVIPNIEWNTTLLLKGVPAHVLHDLMEPMNTQYPIHVKDIKRAYDIKLGKEADETAIYWHIPGWISIILLLFSIGTLIGIIWCAIKMARKQSARGDQAIQLNILGGNPQELHG